VHDKQVRRRRFVLALLVGVSLILLTAYFGESANSPLHSIQRGIVEVLSPVQEGASKALKPVRDVAGWFSDTIDAKSQRDQLEKENQMLRAELAQAQTAQAENIQLTNQLKLDNSGTLASYKPVAAHVISRDPTLWYETIEVDKGSQDGIQKNDPVTGDGALVGEVSTVAPNVCVVTLITDHSFAVTAQVQDGGSGDTGVLVPAVGDPNHLILQYLNRRAPIAANQQVVTAGFKSPSGSLDSLFPKAIPIGQVSNADQNTLLNAGTVEVDPAADLRHLDAVQILTDPQAGSQRAQVPAG
jgi:rod shape-determining protein MreC